MTEQISLLSIKLVFKMLFLLLNCTHGVSFSRDRTRASLWAARASLLAARASDAVTRTSLRSTRISSARILCSAAELVSSSLPHHQAMIPRDPRDNDDAAPPRMSTTKHVRKRPAVSRRGQRQRILGTARADGGS